MTALNASVRYSSSPGGTVRGLVQTTVCAEGGGSSGRLHAGPQGALSRTSGGNCTSDGTTLFQPARAAATYSSVTIY